MMTLFRLVCLTKLRCIVIGDLLKLAPKLLVRLATMMASSGSGLPLGKTLKQLPALDDYRYTIISMHMACLRSRPGRYKLYELYMFLSNLGDSFRIHLTCLHELELVTEVFDTNWCPWLSCRRLRQKFLFMPEPADIGGKRLINLAPVNQILPLRTLSVTQDTSTQKRKLPLYNKYAFWVVKRKLETPTWNITSIGLY